MSRTQPVSTCPKCGSYYYRANMTVLDQSHCPKCSNEMHSEAERNTYGDKKKKGA